MQVLPIAIMEGLTPVKEVPTDEDVLPVVVVEAGASRPRRLRWVLLLLLLLEFGLG
jgi:hypothetical protein